MARWRLPDGVVYPRTRKSTKPATAAINLGETLFNMQCLERGLPMPQRQYKFALSIKNKKSLRGRKWTWDFAWPDLNPPVAVEIDGGLWINGAHGNPLRILDNMDKNNHATLLGWTVLRFSPQQVLRSTHAIDFTVRVIESRLAQGATDARYHQPDSNAPCGTPDPAPEESAPAHHQPD